MEKNLAVTSTITIDAPASKVWDVLTNPEQTKKYMFGCEAISDWEPRSSLLWKGNYEGKEMVFVKGHVVAIDPGKFLSYTTIDPNSTVPDLPENYLTVTYQLSESKGVATLVVTQGNYATVADGDKRYKETVEGGGWNPILVQIKKLVEEN